MTARIMPQIDRIIAIIDNITSLKKENFRFAIGQSHDT